MVSSTANTFNFNREIHVDSDTMEKPSDTVVRIDLTTQPFVPPGYEIAEHAEQEFGFDIRELEHHVMHPGPAASRQPLNACILGPILENADRISVGLQYGRKAMAFYFCKGTTYRKKGEETTDRYVICLFWNTHAWIYEVFRIEEISQHADDFILVM